MKGLRHQLFEALQPMGVVGETEFTEEDEQSREASERREEQLSLSNAAPRVKKHKHTYLQHESRAVKSFHTLLTL